MNQRLIRPVKKPMSVASPVIPGKRKPVKKQPIGKPVGVRAVAPIRMS